MHHPMTNHNAAAFTALCGRDPLKGDLELLSNDRNDPPCYGAIMSANMRERPGLPTFVALPHVMYNVVQLPGQVAGFLGSAHGPFQVNADPSARIFIWVSSSCREISHSTDSTIVQGFWE